MEKKKKKKKKKKKSNDLKFFNKLLKKEYN